MASDSIDFNALAQAADSSWGRSSTPKTESYSVKFSFDGAERLIVSYVAIVNFASERSMIEMKRMYKEESERVVSAAIKSVKKRYKDITDSSIKMNEVSATDSIEIIGFNVHSPKRTAYYRRKSVVEIA
jgi:hypothetical protein